jgi:hypothetical protein
MLTMKRNLLIFFIIFRYLTIRIDHEGSHLEIRQIESGLVQSPWNLVSQKVHGLLSGLTKKSGFYSFNIQVSNIKLRLK